MDVVVLRQAVQHFVVLIQSLFMAQLHLLVDALHQPLLFYKVKCQFGCRFVAFDRYGKLALIHLNFLSGRAFRELIFRFILFEGFLLCFVALCRLRRHLMIETFSWHRQWLLAFEFEGSFLRFKF
jgi:hypothetical protein